jgi:hypothetical protein
MALEDIGSLPVGKSGTRSINERLEDIEANFNSIEASLATLNARSFAVADLPDASLFTGKVIYCADGAAGSPCAAISNGTNWLRITLGAAVAVE